LSPLIYFVLTVAIELPVIVWLLRGSTAEKIRIGFALHLFTWSLLQVLWALTETRLYYLEIVVVMLEGICYQLFFENGWKRSLLVSLLANSLSYGAGLLLNPYI
jgi:hypothetical protein